MLTHRPRSHEGATPAPTNTDEKTPRRKRRGLIVAAGTAAVAGIGAVVAVVGMSGGSAHRSGSGEGSAPAGRHASAAPQKAPKQAASQEHGSTITLPTSLESLLSDDQVDTVLNAPSGTAVQFSATPQTIVNPNGPHIIDYGTWTAPGTTANTLTVEGLENKSYGSLGNQFAVDKTVGPSAPVTIQGYPKLPAIFRSGNGEIPTVEVEVSDSSLLEIAVDDRSTMTVDQKTLEENLAKVILGELSPQAQTS